MNYLLEADLLDYQTQLNMLEENARSCQMDISVLNEASIKEAWSKFIKWVKEKVGPLIKSLVDWGKKIFGLEKKKDEAMKDDIDFILKYQSQMKYAGNAIEKKKLTRYILNINGNDKVLKIIEMVNFTPLNIYIKALQKKALIIYNETGMPNDKFQKEKKEFEENQREIDELKIDNINDCFRSREFNKDEYAMNASYIRLALRRINSDNEGIDKGNKYLNQVNDVYYSIQKTVNAIDKSIAGYEDATIANVLAFGNMLVKQCIDLGTIIRTYIQLFEKDKEYQYAFLRQVKVLMKAALDRGESVEVPNFA